MNLGERLRNGIKWLLLGNIGNRILEFAFGIILARLLIPEDFGLIITLQIVTGLVGAIASGGMGQSLVRAKQASAEEFDVVFSMQLVLGVITYIALFWFAPYFAAFFDNPVYTDLLRVSSVIFIMRPLALIRTSWLRREMSFREISFTTVATGLASGLSGVVMAYQGLGVWALVYSGLVAAVVRNVMLAAYTPLRLRLRFDPKIMRRHSGYGFKVTILDLMGSMKPRIIAFVISKFAGPAALGLYNKGDSLSQLPAVILMPPVGQSAFRALAMIQDNPDQTKYLFYKIVSSLFVFVGPFFLLLWWIAEPFIGLVYGAKWLGSIEPMRILSLSGFFVMLGVPCGVLLKAHDKLVEQIIGQCLNLGVIAAASYIGLQTGGIVGAAWGLFVAQIFGAIVFYWLAYRILPTRIGDLLRALAPGLLLNAGLFVLLMVVDGVLMAYGWSHPLLYMIVMCGLGLSAYGLGFLFLPIPGLGSEPKRWREFINTRVQGLVARFSA